MLEIQLPEDLESRLEELAKKTGRSKASIITESLERYLEDLEDIDRVLAILERVSLGEEKILNSEDIWKGPDD